MSATDRHLNADLVSEAEQIRLEIRQEKEALRVAESLRDVVEIRRLRSGLTELHTELACVNQLVTGRAT